MFDFNFVDNKTFLSFEKLMSPISNALSYNYDNHIPFSGLNRSFSFSDHGII